jgi:leucine dehydrogenase
MVAGGYEQIVFCHDRASGLRAIIAIHDTRLGPALGGIRMRPYPSEEEALRDVLRLSRAMTYKSALAGLDLGGGKSVIIGEPTTQKSEALFRAMGRQIEALGGRYICATDVGTTAQDLLAVRRETRHVTGLPEAWGGLGDTSVLTGMTVYLGMKAAAAEVWGDESLEGRRVVVQGAGKVGLHLMELLRREGSQIAVADPAEDSARRAAEQFGARIVPAERVYDEPCDVFSPNALGGVLNDDTIPRLRCRIVCGGANNQLADPQHGDMLHRHGILYAPDYLVNSGGVISAESEVLHAPRARAESVAQHVRETAERVFALAREQGITPARAADRLAEQRIEQVARVRASFLP